MISLFSGGEIFTLLGQNGAGKSTLISILTTYSRPTSGNVSILGKDLGKEAAVLRSCIACAAQRISIDEHLSLTENMMFQSRLYKVPQAEAKQRMTNLIERFGLNRYLNYPVSSYSGGVKRRLDIALNMMSNPQILFLDLSTALFPADGLSGGLAVAVNLNPFTHVINALRNLFLEDTIVLSNILPIVSLLLIMCLGSFALAVWRLKKEMMN